MENKIFTTLNKLSMCDQQSDRVNKAWFLHLHSSFLLTTAWDCSGMSYTDAPLLRRQTCKRSIQFIVGIECCIGAGLKC